MKARLTLLSHLGKPQEPPIPKPRGTPKLSERYAGSEGFQGPGGVGGWEYPLGVWVGNKAM